MPDFKLPLSPDLKLPLSGDVNQDINPWTLFFRSIGSQFGFVNINLGKSSDPDVEEEILKNVASYGRQLGRIGDAMKVLIKHTNRSELNREEEQALDDCFSLINEIDRFKRKRQGAPDAAAKTANAATSPE